MFKQLETAWNARTPVYLHNRTKENLIFQLALTVVVVGAMIGYEEYKDRKALRKLKTEALKSV